MGMSQYLYIPMGPFSFGMNIHESIHQLFPCSLGAKVLICFDPIAKAIPIGDS